MTVAAAATGLCVAATSLGAMAPTSATLGPNGVTPGHNITVFHNIDMVATTGWTVGEQLTVDVLRNGVLIGTASGPAVDILGEAGLEVNHGPEGTPAPGDCWSGVTPDILPGDTVRVTGDADVDDVIVDDITFSGPAFEDTTNGDVVVAGVAKFADGTPMPISTLDSAEFRDGSALRGVPDEVVADPAVTGGFQMRYHPPYALERNRDNLAPAQVKERLLVGGGHAIGFGHVDPLPDHGMVIEGIEDASGPAPGCEGAAAEQRSVQTVSPAAINMSNASSALTVTGLTALGEEVVVSLTSSNGGTPPAPVQATENGITWAATFPAGSLDGLNDGLLTVSGAYGASALTGVNKTLAMDRTAPAAPTMSPAGRTFIGSQVVTLASSDPDADLHYTTDGSVPTRSSATYVGLPIELTRTATVRAIAIDTADNTSAVRSGSFRRATVASRPAIGTASAGRVGRPFTAFARWRVPSSNGGMAITRYEVNAQRILRGRIVQQRTFLRTAVTRTTQLSLPRGTWRFRVRAVNAVGKSAFSAYSNRTVSR
jgi:hypothetical protein